jgi:SAM-dependent methyltransferase
MPVRAMSYRLMNRWPGVRAAYLVANDLRWGVRLRFGRLDTEMGRARELLPTEWSIQYVERVFADYKTYSGAGIFRGRVAEVGPGDNAGVALLMLWNGCDTVDLIDRYDNRSSHHRQWTVYRSLARRHAQASSALCTDVEKKIGWHIGQPAERFFQRCRAETYDLIVSRAVMQHLYDPLRALSEMVRCLRPGGYLVHKIDLRDLGMFSKSHHELTWLRFPDAIWGRMTANSGRPNRVLVHSYRQMLETLRDDDVLDYRLLSTSLVVAGEIMPHRPYAEINPDDRRRAEAFVESKRGEFARSFREVVTEDLATTGVFLVAHKRV